MLELSSKSRLEPTGERILKVAWAFLSDPPERYIHESGLCLALVREIVMRATGMSYDDFYSKLVDQRVERPKGTPTSWIARDAERSLRAKYAIPPNEARAGDICFKWDAAYIGEDEMYYGHVGILLAVWLGGGVILENVNPSFRRGGLIVNKGAVRLSDFAKWPAVTSYVRLPNNL